MRKLYLLIVFVVFGSCEILPTAPTLIAPAPEYNGSPSIGFEYDNSPTFQGYIRFYNRSLGMKSFQWNFGFSQSSGSPSTSSIGEPKIKFPGNGFYSVTLKGTGIDQNQYSITKVIEVTNN